MSCPQSRPSEGWLVLPLLLVVVLSPALSLVGASWVDDLEVVPSLAVFALLLGFVLSKLPVRGPVAHLFAAEIGVGLIAVYFSSRAPLTDWGGRFEWLWDRISIWLQAALGGGISNDGMLFALLMALCGWWLGYLSAWLTFKKHNVWPCLVGSGSILLINLSYAPQDPVPYFLAFLVASILLVMRMALFQKERDWSNADAEYNRSLTRNFLSGGALLSVAIVLVAWLLPTGQVNAAISDGWYSATAPWHGVQTEFDRLFSSLGSSGAKVDANRFGKALALKGAVELTAEPVMLVSSPRAEYWAAQSYDRYTGQGWLSTMGESTRLEANDPRLAETSLYGGRLDLEQHFKMLVGRSSNVLAATTPVRLSLAVYADFAGNLEQVASLRSIIPLRQGQQYSVISSVSVASIEELKAAGKEYPDWIARYLELPERTQGRSSQTGLSRVRALARRLTEHSRNPYEAAISLQDYLRRLRYELRVGMPPPDRDAVEWFLFETREGYCDYFASAMAVMARSVGIPARVTSGYNTGTFNFDAGYYEVKQENAHSWPELFFPNYGWVRFEPTPSQPAPQRPETAGQASTGSASVGSESGTTDDGASERDKLLLEDEMDFFGAAGGIPADQGIMNASGSVLSGAVLLTIVLLFLVWWRLISRLSASEAAYFKLCLLGMLAGRRLRGAQTAGEYGHQLGGAAPSLATEVATIVNCYSEETYAVRRPADEQAAGQAWRRLRMRFPWEAIRRAASR